MSSLNKVQLIGRLGQDPEFKVLPNGSVATLSVATSEKWRDKNTGEQKEQTEWHRVVFYGRQSEICRDYLQKGSQIYVEGKNKTRKWQDQNGQDRYTTEVHGNQLLILSSPAGQGQGQNAGGQASGGNRHANNAQPAQNSNQGNATPPMDFDDDIPF